ncbi:MAG TPA: hypothetical protein VHZ25_02635 [Acidobacteriaceae bacterium]|nr:hypothetical protein [Acidobacteriaceae bacterium]
MPPLNEWNTLLAVQAGAAATLTGLIFVAVSINLANPPARKFVGQFLWEHLR